MFPRKNVLVVTLSPAVGGKPVQILNDRLFTPLSKIRGIEP